MKKKLGRIVVVEENNSFDINATLQLGINATLRGDFPKALKCLRSILEIEPKHPEANFTMGELANRLGKSEAALPFYRASVRHDNTNVRYLKTLVETLITLEMIEEAHDEYNKAGTDSFSSEDIEIFERLLKVSGNAPESSKGPDYEDLSLNSHIEPSSKDLDLLLNLYQVGKIERASSFGDQLVAKFPTSAKVLDILGVIYQKQGRNNEAIDLHKKAIKINPSFSPAYNNLGNALAYAGSLLDSREAYNSAIALQPENAAAYINLGNVLKRLGMWVDALKAYKKSISLQSDNADAFYNMGIALYETGKFNEAIRSYQKALTIRPHSGTYNNLGNALTENGKLDEAIDSYHNALKLNPENTMAYNNLGNVFKEMGRFAEAGAAYQKAIFLQPDKPSAYNNLGNNFTAEGKLEDAIAAYKKAIELKPDYGDAYDNIYYPLLCSKVMSSSEKSLYSLLPKPTQSIWSQKSVAALNYRLRMGDMFAEDILTETLNIFSTAKNKIIKNPENRKKSVDVGGLLPEKITALVHFGRSGTTLLHSLIDSHSSVSSFPCRYFSEYFNESNWEKIISNGWAGMIDRFIAIYDILFDASSSMPIDNKGNKPLRMIGIKEGMANVGEQRNEVLQVDRNIFREELNCLMAHYNELDAFVFFKLAHKAFDKAINDINPKDMIFYHIHNPRNYTLLNFLSFAPGTKWVMMVREPIQSCESWCRDSFNEKNYEAMTTKITHMLSEVSSPIFRGDASIGVRLEDLKSFPRKTIPALCDWLEIAEEESLYEMTAQGKRWWGTPSSPDYLKDGMNPFGDISINREVGLIFSENDQFILRTLFYPFCVSFGYVDDDPDKFIEDLQIIRPMLDQMFDFEKSLVRETETDTVTFIKSGSYLYLRSHLIECWNTLKKYRTYPNMIKPLKIGNVEPIKIEE